MESTSGRRRPMVRRVLQVPDRLHLQSALQKRPHRVRRDGRLRHTRQPLPHAPPASHPQTTGIGNGGNKLRPHRPQRDPRRLRQLPRQVELPRRLPRHRASLLRPRQKVLRHLAELPRKRPHLRRPRLRRHLRLGVHRHREPLRHRRQPPQLQIRPHPHHPAPSHPSAPSPSSAACAPPAASPPPSTSTSSTTPRKPAPGTLTFTAITPSNKLLKLTELPAPATRPDLQLPPQRVLHHPTPHRRRPVPLQVRPLLRPALHPNQRDLGHRSLQPTNAPAHSNDRSLRNHTRTPQATRPISHHASAFEVEDFTRGKKYDVIITSGLTATTNATQNSGDTTGLEAQPIGSANGGTDVGGIQTTTQLGHIDPAILEAVRAGTPLLAIPQADTLSEGVAKQLAAAGAFTYNGAVGDYRAPWMGNWYFVRKHPIYAGLPVNQAMGIHYQSPGRQANGLLVDRTPTAPHRDHRRLLPRPRPQDRCRHLHHQTRRRQAHLPPRPRPPPRPPATPPRQRPGVAHRLGALRRRRSI